MSGTGPGLAAISGPLLLGYMFNWGLLGVLSVQVYFYILAFPKDRRMTKSLVSGLYILELIQTTLLAYDAFCTYAIHFGDVGFVNNTQLLPLLIPIFNGLVSLPVQLFYGYMLQKVSGSRLLGLIVALFSILQCSAAFVQGVQAFVFKDFSDLAIHAKASNTIWLTGSTICDIIIASGMSFILLKRDTGLPATHALITRLVRIIVETGSLTALSATVTMVLFISLPDKPYFTCLGFVLSKLYSNSLLAILNSRIRIEGVHTKATANAIISSLVFHKQTTFPLTSVTPDSDSTGSLVVNIHIQCDSGLEA